MFRVTICKSYEQEQLLIQQETSEMLFEDPLTAPQDSDK